MTFTQAETTPTSFLKHLAEVQSPTVVCEGGENKGIECKGAWNNQIWSGSITNQSSKPAKIKEVILFEGEHHLRPDTRVYGESFQMLAQITGTLQAPTDLGGYPDRTHYRIPEPEGYRTASGLLTLYPGDQTIALAFTSCQKFIGRIGFNQSRIKIFIETEGLTLPPKGQWRLESFGCFEGKNRDEVMQKVASEIQKNHPRTLPEKPATGWCSWYSFYEDVTSADIERNLAFSKKNLPELRYIQIDDGFQPKWGDWLDTGKAFGGDVRKVISKIKKEGFEPAIWVAPFIAEKTSNIFQQHPEWFIKGPDGKPLDSSKIGFGGWRCGPWYVLDGTHPEVQKHLEKVFKTMKEEWGVTYFKLDANYWGAIHGGKHYDSGATRIDAYREGMKAIQRGAGDALLLGCNAPIWPSLGLVDGMRTSNDTEHTWKQFRSCGLENLSRGWQNGKLWWNDPDCLLLTENSEKNISKNIPLQDPTLTDNQFKLELAAVLATGGFLFSGDEMGKIKPNRFQAFKRLLSVSGKGMHFENPDFSIGRVQYTNSKELIALFNWDETQVTRKISVEPNSTVTDFWSGSRKKVKKSTLSYDVPPRSAIILEIEK